MSDQKKSEAPRNSTDGLFLTTAERERVLDGDAAEATRKQLLAQAQDPRVVLALAGMRSAARPAPDLPLRDVVASERVEHAASKTVPPRTRHDTLEVVARVKLAGGASESAQLPSGRPDAETIVTRAVQVGGVADGEAPSAGEHAIDRASGVGPVARAPRPGRTRKAAWVVGILMAACLAILALAAIGDGDEETGAPAVGGSAAPSAIATAVPGSVPSAEIAAPPAGSGEPGVVEPAGGSTSSGGAASGPAPTTTRPAGTGARTAPSAPASTTGSGDPYDAGAGGAATVPTPPATGAPAATAAPAATGAATTSPTYKPSFSLPQKKQH